MAQSRPTCTVVCVEPVNQMIAKLRDGLSLNPTIERVDVVHAFLAAPGADQPPVPRLVGASWSLFDDATERMESEAIALSTDGAVRTTLDDLVASLGLSRVDVVKVDVDGFELDVLRGARRTLRRFAPLLVMEWWSPGSQSSQHADSKMLVDLLKEAGYRPQGIRRSGRTTGIGWDRLDRVRDGASRDVVFVPSHEA